MKRIFLVMIGMSAYMNGYSQFTTYTSYESTTALIQGVGIGNFATPLIPLGARLHVNNFYTASPAGGLNGLLFRTDGSNAVQNSWSMWTGATVATTEKFRLYIPATLNTSVVFQTMQAD